MFGHVALGTFPHITSLLNHSVYDLNLLHPTIWILVVYCTPLFGPLLDHNVAASSTSNSVATSRTIINIHSQITLKYR